ncbi:hypothetical protein LCGC14_0780710 [marine sediment metagenome]|uniref:Uncharacterized protein n=1 Tax=marine sediment metagenome TaxID=412755 RepID=A0A0F9PVP7_9ZZZZ
MMSSNVDKSDQILRITDLFYEEKIKKELIEDIKNIFDEPENENYIILKEIQEILENCSNLTDKQKLDYCKSQRFFMKLYLREINKR